MNKRGQLTIFIIIALLIVAAIAGYFFIRGKIVFSETQLPPEAQSVKTFVDECLDSAAEETIYYIGQGGGYFVPPEISTKEGVTYYYKNKQNYIPTKEYIEEEIALFTAAQTIACVNNFSGFPDLDIRGEKIDASAKIKNEKIIIGLDYPLRITKGESVTVIKDFETIVPVRLGIVYNSVYKIFGKEPDYEGVCLSCILEESEKNDFYVDMLDEDDGTTIFIFRDEQSIIGNKTFEFMFANKYEFMSEEELDLE